MEILKSPPGIDRVWYSLGPMTARWAAEELAHLAGIAAADWDEAE